MNSERVALVDAERNLELWWILHIQACPNGCTGSSNGQCADGYKIRMAMMFIRQVMET